MPLLVRRVGARRVRATADMCVEWPERRGVPLAERRGDVGVRARGAALSLPPCQWPELRRTAQWLCPGSGQLGALW